MEWSVLIETEAEGASVDEDQAAVLVGRLVEQLADYGGAVAGDHRGWSARISIETSADIDAAFRAIEAGRQAVVGAALRAGFPPWPVIRAEAIEADTFHAELEVVNFPEVLGTTEVSKVLGVSRQRLHELRAQGRFPEPIVELAGGPLWIRASVDRFLAGWARRPGRPRTAVSSSP